MVLRLQLSFVSFIKLNLKGFIMDYEIYELFNDYALLIEVVDKSGRQESGEFKSRVRDPDINAIACKYLNDTRRKIIAADNASKKN